MGRIVAAGAFACLEYTIVFLFIAALAFVLVQQLDNIVPEGYDYSAEQELLDAIREGYESKQITYRQTVEILQIYQDDLARRERLRTYILYVISSCISSGLMVLLFKKYRSLRFRERFRDYLFPAKP
jgi:hypothetical protein